jgi:2',3'-cyclic-nucleotide 2'-phosphodiesterase (5'-nucleotidase family)
VSANKACPLPPAVLQAEGAEVVIALTHMRVPNDRKLLKEVADIDVVLGGHDHHYEVGVANIQ